MKTAKRIHVALATCLAGLLAISCQSEQTANVIVNNEGVLREIMMMGELQARANLKDYTETPNLYALGAIEGLAGEILILNGFPLNGQVMNDGLQIQKTFDLKAALLVSSQVAEWDTLELNTEISDITALQEFIPSVFNEKPDQAFPFQIIGDGGSLDWHVINAPAATERNHDAYKASGLSGNISNKEVSILGFYSEAHEGVFTHHGSYLHMHFIDNAEQTMGHIDGLKWSGQMQLLVPKALNR